MFYILRPDLAFVRCKFHTLILHDKQLIDSSKKYLCWTLYVHICNVCILLLWSGAKVPKSNNVTKKTGLSWFLVVLWWLNSMMPITRAAWVWSCCDCSDVSLPKCQLLMLLRSNGLTSGLPRRPSPPRPHAAWPAPPCTPASGWAPGTWKARWGTACSPSGSLSGSWDRHTDTETFPPRLRARYLLL